MEKAKAIATRHGKSCDICFLLDSQAKNSKFFVYKKGFYEEGDHYICEGCKAGLEEIRNKCKQKIDNPKHKIFKNFTPWFLKALPGSTEKFKKYKSTEKT